ncbi:MAG: GumC family protein [Panacagrimonas sp.]
MNLPAVRHDIPVAPQPAPSPPAIHMGDILHLVFLRMKSIVAVFLGVVFTAAFLVFYLVSPSYQSGVSIVINSQDLILPVVEGAAASDVQKLKTFHTQKDIINSAQIASEVVDRLDLGNRRVISRIEGFKIAIRGYKRQLGFKLDIQGWQSPEDFRARAIAAVAGGVELEGKPDSQALLITYTANHPQEAADTLNMLVQVYKEYYNDQVKKTAAGLSTYLESQLRDVNRQLAANEQQILSFKRADRVNLSTPRRLAAPDASSSIGSVPQSAIASAAGSSISLLGITDSPTVQNEMKLYVLAMEDELRKLLADYTENAPRVIELREKIHAYTEAINKVPERELDLVRLKRVYEINQDAEIDLRRNLEKARAVQAANTGAINVITVLDPAAPNFKAVAPKRQLAMIAALIFGVALGLIVALVRHYFDHSLRTPREVEMYLGVKSLGSLQAFR